MIAHPKGGGRRPTRRQRSPARPPGSCLLRQPGWDPCRGGRGTKAEANNPRRHPPPLHREERRRTHTWALPGDSSPEGRRAAAHPEAALPGATGQLFG